MLATGPPARLLLAPRSSLCRPCANLASHARLTPSRSFSTTPWRRGKGGLASLGRSKGPVDRSQQYALPSTPARTRFAPSPTGYLHLGSLRTALYNYLLARATGGKFIVRIEDTDRLRVVDNAEARLFDDLRWANLSWDEGPDVGGPYGPYRQSERLAKYRPYADQLLTSGHAYRCFCTASDLEKHKEHAAARNLPTQYPGTCRAVPPEESADRAARGETHVVRFRGGERLSFVDRVYGRYEKKQEEEDFILVKSDGFPTYHFANVVDDHLMDITHVIRGAEWLISTPKHIALYEALGFDPPEFSHVGLLVDAAGQKLSKRNHDVDVSSYRGRVVPSALNNWLVLLGWGMPQGSSKNSEVFTEMEDLVSKFSFKFTKGTIKVNPQKLDAFQHKHTEHLLASPTPNLPILREALLDPTETFIRTVDARRQAPEPETTTSSSGRPFDFSQRGELLPQFGTAESSAEYLLCLFQVNTTRYPQPSDLVLENPQLIWDVPPHVYARSAESTPRDQTLQVLTALETELAPSKVADWERAPLQSAVASVIAALAPEYPTPEAARDAVYEALRFSLMGDPHLPSKPANMVMFLLGRAGTDARFARAKEALR